MSRVNVKNVCKCFIKSAMAESQEFKDPKEAEQEAQEMIAKMRAEFCKKHDFVIVKEFDDFNIVIKPRV